MATNTSVDSKLSNYATKNELSDYATKEELMDYATQEDITGIEHQLSNYATNTSVSQALANKQDVLVFDDAPQDGSTNPVTSQGIFNAIKTSGGGLSVFERPDLAEMISPYLQLTEYNYTNRIDTSNYVSNFTKNLKVFVLDDGKPAVEVGGNYFKPDVQLVFVLDFEGVYINSDGKYPGIFAACDLSWFELSDCHLYLDSAKINTNPSIINYVSGDKNGVAYNEVSYVWSTSSGGVTERYAGAKVELPYLRQNTHFKYHVTWVRHGHFMSTNEFTLTYTV